MNLSVWAAQGIFVLAHLGVAAGVAGIAFAFGCLLTSRIQWNGRAERAVVAITVGLGGLAQLLFFLGLLGWLRPLPVSAALLGILIVFTYRTWQARRTGLPHWNRQTCTQIALVALPAVLPILLLPLYPPTAPDATMYHLPYAKVFAATGALPSLPHLRFPVFPQLNELLFTGALLLWDDLGAQMIEALAALLTAGILAVWGRSRGSPGAGALAAAFWLGTPMVVQLSGAAYVDLGLTLFFTLAAYACDRWRLSEERAWLTIAAFAAGCAAASKYTGLFAVAGVVLFAAWDGRGDRLRMAAWAGLVAGLTLAPWYLRIFFLTGNPVYPLFEDYLGGAERTPLFGSAASMLRANGGLERAIASWAKLPWTLVAGTPYSSSVWSPIYLVGLPLAIWIGLREPWGRRIGAAVVTFSLVFALLSFPDIRLLLPVAPLWCILIGTGCDRLVAWLVPAARIRVQVLAALVVAALLPGLWKGMGELNRLGRFPVTPAEREAYLRIHLPSYPALAHLHRVRGNRWSVYAVFAENLAYYARGRYQGDWFGPAAYGGVFPTTADPDAFADRLAELGADHLLVTQAGYPFPLRQDAAFARRFELIFNEAGVRLYRLTHTRQRYLS
jgi:hypothetical protein